MKMIITALFFLIIPPLDAERLYSSKPSNANKEALQNRKIKCRLVCDKKLYKEQKIAEAVSFYKNSQYYTFKKTLSNSYE
jgi:hypothetical protein